MLDAFDKGGDFHSRTAANMFDYIKKDIDQNKITLENNDHGIPTLK